MPGLAATLRSWLAHPLTRGLSIDDPRTTEVRRRIIREKPFLRRIYEDWYRQIAESVPDGPGEVLELGSGAGFLHEFIPGLITSEVFPCSGVMMVVDARELPFADASLRAIVMTDVLHHISEPRRFFAEAVRCVRPGGVITMIEPWVTPWSRMVYTRLHHEPFRPDAAEWEFPASGPLSGANGALPWMMFSRDRDLFESEFRTLRIERVVSHTPLRYLLSGAVSMRSIMPGWAHRPVHFLEAASAPARSMVSMFATVMLRREADPRSDHDGT